MEVVCVFWGFSNSFSSSYYPPYFVLLSEENDPGSCVVPETPARVRFLHRVYCERMYQGVCSQSSPILPEPSANWCSVFVGVGGGRTDFSLVGLYLYPHTPGDKDAQAVCENTASVGCGVSSAPRWSSTNRRHRNMSTRRLSS